MFSSRFSEPSPERSPLWEALESLRGQGTDVFDLTESNPTAAGIAYPDGLLAPLSRADVLRYRPSPRGFLDARRAIAAHLGSQAWKSPGAPCDPDRLLLTASTSEAYGFLFKLLCDPGDEVLIPSPSYPLFDTLAELEHVKLVRYPLRFHPAEGGRGPVREGRWRPDMGFLRRQMSTRCKAIILVNPNNPTGHLAHADEQAAYLELARDYGLSLIVDEVFSEYLLDTPSGAAAYRPLTSQGPLVFTLNGLSKLAGLPQLKLGWIHVGGESRKAAEALDHLEWIADAFLSVNTPVQAACPALLASAPAIRDAILARLRQNLETACALVRTAPGSASTGSGAASPGSESRVSIFRPEGGWYLVAEIRTGGDEEDFALRLLRERRTYVHPGHLFGFEGEEEGVFHLVLSLLPPENRFREGFQRLLAHCEDLHE